MAFYFPTTYQSHNRSLIPAYHSAAHISGARRGSATPPFLLSTIRWYACKLSRLCTLQDYEGRLASSHHNQKRLVNTSSSILYIINKPFLSSLIRTRSISCTPVVGTYHYNSTKHETVMCNLTNSFGTATLLTPLRSPFQDHGRRTVVSAQAHNDTDVQIYDGLALGSGISCMHNTIVAAPICSRELSVGVAGPIVPSCTSVGDRVGSQHLSPLPHFWDLPCFTLQV